MTVPSERLRSLHALKQASMLIFERGDKRPKLSELRSIFRSALKHYPSSYEIDEIAKRVPKLFARSKNDIIYEPVFGGKPPKRRTNRKSRR